MLGPEETLVVVEAGARWGVDERWRGRPDVRVIGFEPDTEECSRLQSVDPDVTYVPLALGPVDGEITLHITKDSACASIYPPSEVVAEQRPELKVIQSVGETVVPITTLDRWAAANGIDEVHVLKLDTQGSELGVLEGATRLLGTVRAIEVEVELNPMYEGQPLFGDVDRFLREHGFVLWRLQDLVHYGLRDASSARTTLVQRQYYDSCAVESPGAGGQLFWAHAYYVAHEMAWPTGDMPIAQARRDAAAVRLFGFDDLADSILTNADRSR